MVRLSIFILRRKEPIEQNDIMGLWFENNKKQLQSIYRVSETFKVLRKYQLIESSQQPSKVSIVIILILHSRKQR